MAKKALLKKNLLFKITSKHITEILLGIFITFLFLTHIQWIANNDLLIHEVNQEHTPKAIFYYKHLATSFESFLNAYADIRHDTSYWPVVRSPLIYFVTSTINCLIGFSIFKMQLAFFLFFLILIFSTYFIAKTFTNKKIGLLASILVAFNPSVFHYSHIYNQDLPLAAMVALGICFLILCDNFKNFKYSLLLGVVFGLGVLTKPTAIIYLFVPLAISLYSPIKQLILSSKKKDNVNIALNILLFFYIFVTIAWVWFGYKLKWILPNCCLEFISRKRVSSGSNPMFFYAINFYKASGPILFFLFCVAVPNTFKTKKKHYLLIIAWFLSSYLFLTLIVNQQIRFFLPIMPAIAILTAIGLYKLYSNPFKNPLVLGILFLLFYQFIYLSFFPRVITHSSLNIHSVLFAKSNRPPQVYWDSPEGRTYISFFEKTFKDTNGKQLILKKIARYYNHLEYFDAEKPPTGNDFQLSLSLAFKQYLLFKKPYLLINALPDKELALLFISCDKTK